MHWLNTAWQLIKDVALTGTGIILILSQIFSAKPSDVLLVTGLALTVPSVAGHTVSLLSGPHASSSSPPSQPPGAQPSSKPQREDTGD